MDSKENTGGQNTFRSFLTVFLTWKAKNSSNYKIILFIFASKDLMLIIFVVFFTAESNCPFVKHNQDGNVFKGFKVPDEHYITVKECLEMRICFWKPIIIHTL